MNCKTNNERRVSGSRGSHGWREVLKKRIGKKFKEQTAVNEIVHLGKQDTKACGDVVIVICVN